MVVKVIDEHQSNLKLYDLLEKQRNCQIFQPILQEANDKPPDTLDTVHHLGPKKTNSVVSRGITLQFIPETYRSAVWHSAQLAGDLLSTGKGERDFGQLWKKAWKENKPASSVCEWNRSILTINDSDLWNTVLHAVAYVCISEFLSFCELLLVQLNVLEAFWLLFTLLSRH